MKTIKVHNYSIFIGQGLIQEINSLAGIYKYSKAVIVTDKNIPESFSQDLQKALSIDSSVVVLNSGEKNKNTESLELIWETLKDFDCDRQSLVINLGGGMIGDLGGFAAATYMRGIDFVQIPTSLLAAVDESAGGKVGINFAGIKNLIGSFQQPSAVIIDIDTLSTLPKREFISGFAEIIKHGLIADSNYFKLATVKKAMDFSKEELIEIIEGSCRIKKEITEADEKEAGLRKILNFGHTIGHAIEALSQETKEPLLHGEAVSIGMVTEAKISNLIGLITEEEYEQIKGVLLAAGLPVEVSGFSADEIMEKIKLDKKNKKGKINWTLLKNIGQAVFDRHLDEAIARQVL